MSHFAVLLLYLFLSKADIRISTCVGKSTQQYALINSVVLIRTLLRGKGSLGPFELGIRTMEKNTPECSLQLRWA